MAGRDDYIPVEVKRTVRQHSRGFCQYLDCTKELVDIDPLSGKTKDQGLYAHILPVGDGPRAEYKADFPHIDINSAQNLIYLCPDHHQLIDEIAPEKHPPHILFRMKADKYPLLRDSITEALAQESALQIGIDAYVKEYELHAVIDTFREARLLGPKNGASVFREGETLMRSLIKNAFLQKGKIGEILLTTEYQFSRLFIFYKARFWREALDHTTRALRLDLPDPVTLHLLSCSMTLVRDEYGTLQTKEKLALISQLVGIIDKKLAGRTDDGVAAFLLLSKSAFLRWRGRFERGPNQRNTFGAAERCAAKSYDLCRNPGSLLQSALINFSVALSYGLREAPKHRPFLQRCFEILDGPELTAFPAAIKYRPRIYRDTYRFSDSITAFWRGADVYRSEFRRVAYLVGEAAVGEHYHHYRAELDHLADAHKILDQSIQEGYGHGRNVAAYINCRGVLEPDWFEDEVLSRLFDADGQTVPWDSVVNRIRNVLYDPHDKYDEPTFGIDEGEFWSTIGGLTGRTLQDHKTAVRLLRIAEQHGEVSGGRFRAYVGLAREYKEIGDTPSYEHYLSQARTAARAHQETVITELENW
jgi:hypothetical protein